jgi:hypothetical protein
MVEAARRMKAAWTAAPGCVAHVSMCTSSGTNPARTIKRLHCRPPRRCLAFAGLKQIAQCRQDSRAHVAARVLKGFAGMPH